MKKKKNISQADWQQIHDALELQGTAVEPTAGMTEDARSLLEELKAIRSGAQQLEGWQEVDVKGDWQSVKSRLGLPDARPVVRRLPVRTILRFAAAVLLPVAITAGVLLYLRHPGKQQGGQPGASLAQTGAAATNISLTLSDGRTKILEYGNELLETSDALLARNKDGQWRQIADRKELPTGTHLLEVPAGHTATLTLEDGSRIWLNAGSTLRYPARFNGSSREAVMTGEACYEIAGNALAPFTVEAGPQKIQVLGTLFNVNAYSDRVVTTLASGKIAVNTGGEPARVLAPGQQAISGADGKNLLITAADPALALAWHSGNIAFNDIPLPELLEQLGRIYNYRIRYAGRNRYDSLHYNVPVMPRPANIQHMLELIRATTPGDIQFKVDSAEHILTVQ